MPFEKRRPTLLQLGFNESAIPQLKAFIDLLWQSNEDLNLVSRKMTFDDFLDNHIIDCLLALQYFPKSAMTVADFGSGGGLPAVLYAIQFPQIKFQLYEKSNKKQDFLNKCKLITKNIQIFGEIPAQLPLVDLVIARAFKPIDVILDVSRSFYEKGGKYFLLKARQEKILEELALAKKKFKNLNCILQPLHSPVLEVERHLVLVNNLL